MKVLFFLVIFCFLGCVEDAENADDAQVDSVEVAVDTERADSSSEVRLRSDGLTLWVRPVIQTPTNRRSSWLLSGRVSRNITAIMGTVKSEQIDLQQLSKRKFEISISPEYFEKALAHGIFIRMQTSAGIHTIRLLLEGRLDAGTGSSYIYPYRRIQLRADRGSPVFRATVSTRKNFDTLIGSNDDDSEPDSTRVSARKFYLDFQPGLLTWAATPYQDALVLMGESNGRRYQRDAFIGVVLSEIGLTNGDPESLWPTPRCKRTGSVAEQLACGPQIADALVHRFAQDFRAFIIDHYRDNSDAIELAGGVERTQALLNVDSSDISKVTAQGLGYDPSSVIVFAHPDVIFPGSGKVWVGAYHLLNGRLIEITHRVR